MHINFLSLPAAQVLFKCITHLVYHVYIPVLKESVFFSFHHNFKTVTGF